MSDFEKQPEKINLKEIWFKMFSNWKLLISIFVLILSGTYLYLRYTTPMYEASIKIIIKDDENTTSGLSETSAFEDLKIMQFNNSIENEKSVISSRTIMGNVVDSLKIDVILKSIGGVTGLTKRDLYGNAPVEIHINDSLQKRADLRFKFKLKILDDKKASLINEKGNILKTVEFNQPFYFKDFDCELSINKTELFTENSIGKQIQVNKYYQADVISNLLSQTNIEQLVSNGSILTISIQNPSSEKAIDILNTLILKYNDDVVKDKTLITKNTDKFINDRIKIISNELEIIETYSQKFKEDNKLNDIPFEVEQTIINKNEFSKNIIDANVQLELGIMMKDYIDDVSNENSLIPSNLGLSDLTIQKSVEIYNRLTLQRTEELKTATVENPEVQNLTNRISKVKASIKQGIDNLIKSKEKILKKYRDENQNIRNNLSLLPGYEKNYRSIQRQQEIKETLYLYLLEKREENQIAMSMGIGNAKVVDPAFSSSQIVYPKPKIFYLAAVLFSLLLFSIITYLKGLFNDKIYTKNDIDKFDLPYIGNIPLGEKK
jgi:uncharacterized protein involved in exopolysaccharide biosynthesis